MTGYETRIPPQYYYAANYQQTPIGNDFMYNAASLAYQPYSQPQADVYQPSSPNVDLAAIGAGAIAAPIAYNYTEKHLFNKDGSVNRFLMKLIDRENRIANEYLVPAEVAKRNSLKGFETQLSRLQNIEQGLKGLPADVTPENLKKYIVENAEKFNLKGTPQEIAQKAEKIAAKGRDTLIQKLGDGISNVKTKITNHQSAYKQALEGVLNPGTQNIQSGAKKIITNAIDKFKWGKAGVIGAAVAGGVYILGKLFTSNK